MHKEIYKLIGRIFDIFEKAINGVSNAKERLVILFSLIIFGLAIFGIFTIYTGNERRMDKAQERSDNDCVQSIRRLEKRVERGDSTIVAMTIITAKDRTKMDSMIMILNAITAKNIIELENKIKLQEDEKKRLRRQSR